MIVFGFFSNISKEFIDTEKGMLIFSLCIDSLNIFSEFYIIHSFAVALQENGLNYALLCLRGKHGWTPFLDIIRKN